MKIKVNNHLLTIKKEKGRYLYTISHILVKFGQNIFYNLEEYYNSESDNFESYFGFYDFFIYSKNNSSWLYYLSVLDCHARDVTKSDLTNRIIFILNYLFDYLCFKY